MAQNRPNLRSNDDQPVLFRIIDVLLIIISLLFVMALFQQKFNTEYLSLLTLNISAFLFLSESFQLYKKQKLVKVSQKAMTAFAVASISFLMVISVLFLMKQGDTFSRPTVLTWFIMTIVTLMLWRFVYHHLEVKLYKEGVNLSRVAIMGFTPTGKSLFEQLQKYPELGYEFVGFYDDRDIERLPEREVMVGTLQDALDSAQAGHLDSVYICLPWAAEARIARIISTLSDSTVNVFIVPDFLASTLMHGNLGSIGTMDTISVFETPISGTQTFYKRGFDILFSATALIMLAPVLLIITLFVKLSSKGPILFVQDRYGLDGKRIKVHKFRSMTVMENTDKVVQATKGDSRITKIGGILRKTSMDELPQFWDVLTGRMSVVGPRPHAVAHNEEYRKLVDYYMLRHKVKPGITGWAQVNDLRGETDTLEKMEKRIEYDLQYIRNWTLLWDIKIIIKTILNIFNSNNAY